METYLLFFGKSQDFTFKAYTEAGLVEDFNQVIKNFSLLESDWLNVDQKKMSPCWLDIILAIRANNTA